MKPPSTLLFSSWPCRNVKVNINSFTYFDVELMSIVLIVYCPSQIYQRKASHLEYGKGAADLKICGSAAEKASNLVLIFYCSPLQNSIMSSIFIIVLLNFHGIFQWSICHLIVGQGMSHLCAPFACVMINTDPCSSKILAEQIWWHWSNGNKANNFNLDDDSAPLWLSCIKNLMALKW